MANSDADCCLVACTITVFAVEIDCLLYTELGLESAETRINPGATYGSEKLNLTLGIDALETVVRLYEG